jgi:hypothetical protein
MKRGSHAKIDVTLLHQRNTAQTGNEYWFLHFGGKTIRRMDESCFTDLLIMHIPLATFLSKFKSEPLDGASRIGICMTGQVSTAGTKYPDRMLIWHLNKSSSPDPGK